ncbi:MAG: type II toxin-antitoxin system HicB family antitoxin [Acutalibacteraceae bacterium]
MKTAYPVVLIHDNDGYLVKIPDFDFMTQGENIPDAIDMARDAISLMGVQYQDEKKELPQPSQPYDISHSENEIITLVDVDFQAYRKMLENRSVRKNCTIPAWLNTIAEKNNINFSAVLQAALMEKLGLNS